MESQEPGRQAGRQGHDQRLIWAILPKTKDYDIKIFPPKSFNLPLIPILSPGISWDPSPIHPAR